MNEKQDRAIVRVDALRRGAFWACITVALGCALGLLALARFEGRPLVQQETASPTGSESAATATQASRQMPPSAANPASGIEPASESLWPAPSFLGQAVGAVGFAPFVQAAHSKGTIEQLSEALSVLEECARIDREIELVHRDRKPNGLDNNLLRQYQAISRACQTIGPAERALRLPMLKQLANSSAEASVRYFLALRSAGVEPSVLSEALMAIHKWALRGDLASAVFLAHSSSAADLGPVEQRALLLALRAMANGSAEDLMHFDHPGWKTPAQRPLSPASLEAQAQVRSQIILADMQAARAAR